MTEGFSKTLAPYAHLVLPPGLPFRDVIEVERVRAVGRDKRVNVRKYKIGDLLLVAFFEIPGRPTHF